MKFPAFEYVRPSSLAEAQSCLAAARGDAKIISGGQSLLPTMAFRLAAPSILVDIGNVPGLGHIRIDEDGVRLGARVRWVDIERDERLAAAHPLLAAAIEHVAHYQIRNRGTVGGSVAHADPSAEMPGVAVACDAQIAVLGSGGERLLPAVEFFTGALSTVLADDELITEVRLPAWPQGRKWGFEEFARRRGDFAIAGVAAYYDLAPDGTAAGVHVGVIGACHRPHRVAEVESFLNGRTIDDGTIGEACRLMARSVEPPEDFHASAEYRRSLAATLLGRTLARAAAL